MIKINVGKRGYPIKIPDCLTILLVICFTTLSFVYSKCHGVDMKLSIFPEQSNIVYGNPLELFCTTETHSSNEISFRIGGEDIESEIINSTTRRLYIMKPEKQIGTYYCRNTKTHKICISRVIIDSPPGDIIDFKCISKNLEYLNCSWTSQRSFTFIDYKIGFYVDGSYRSGHGSAKRIQNSPTRYYYEWSKDSSPRYKQQEEQVSIYVTECNIFGCNNQTFNIDHYSIVKPDRPTDLRVIKFDAHSAMLKWRIPDNMLDFLKCGVEHILEYSTPEDTHFHAVDTSTLPLRNKTYVFTLTGLPYAHTLYEVRLRIKSTKAISSEYWSDFDYIIFTTSGEIPKRPPSMITGAFDQTIYKDNSRKITIYWIPLDKHEEAGTNFNYKILVLQNNETQILYPEINNSRTHASLSANFDALEVTVWSHNTNGTSINSSHIYIPPEIDTRTLKVRSFTKHVHENGTHELSWVGIENIDNYTLLWCQQDSKRHSCEYDLDFIILDPKENSYLVHLPKENNYQFGISANDGSKSSGIIWPQCELSNDEFLMYHFIVHSQKHSNTSVTLKWALDCVFRDGIVRGYAVSYCPVAEDIDDCDKSTENNYVNISDPKQTKLTIENLHPLKNYKFTFVLETIYGQKVIDIP